jgi:cystathionine beta-lyase/cystathionine gamma-synthase
LRSRAASDNAARIATLLEDHEKVEWVRYPGLPSHPDHAVARRLLGERFGAMVTFKPRGGLDSMAAFTDHLRLCDIGVSLGDIHTLVYPRPKDGGIIRLSIGCEDLDDLREDFELGLSFVV